MASTEMIANSEQIVNSKNLEYIVEFQLLSTLIYKYMKYL